MDLREKKTIRSIRDAFLRLRNSAPLERITVKELAELAEISKATFYLHYRDIYDLSESLQNEVIQSVLASVAHPEYCLTDQKAFTEELLYGFYAQQSLIEVLFSGTQAPVLPMRIEKELRTFLEKWRHDMDPETDMLLTYKIQGAYYVYQQHVKTYGIETVARTVARAAEAITTEK